MRHVATITAFVVTLLLPTACGREPEGATPSTVHVRVAGMVESLGIT